jgi:hypothetical protein
MINPVLNEITKAMRYGFKASASRSDVFSLLPSGFAARVDPRKRKPAEILEIAKSTA